MLYKTEVLVMVRCFGKFGRQIRDWAIIVIYHHYVKKPLQNPRVWGVYSHLFFYEIFWREKNDKQNFIIPFPIYIHHKLWILLVLILLVKKFRFLKANTPCHELDSNTQFTTLVVIGTDCTGSSKYNYHTIMTMTATLIWWDKLLSDQ
jgi:hypothetical protein